jgi:hypothetical protein
MGGFTSVTEGLPSGNSTTASGVPLGNADFSATPDSTNFAMPEPVNSGTWANDAFAPVQAMPEPNNVPVKIVDPETVGWKPATLQETRPRNQLADNVFAPATQAREDRVDPIVSKLAREHRDNPVPLRGSLLGAPETPDYKMSGIMPTKEDELPKVDWAAYEKHRIDGKTRISHDNWARLINSTKDFGGIIPTFKLHIETNGDIGRGDVADMIGRAAQSDPDHARFFQRELSNALGGKTIPARIARLAGEPTDNRDAPGLLGQGKPSQYPSAQMRDEDRRQLENYKAEFEKTQQQPMATEEPRQSDPGKRGVISSNPENPDYPDRGNFADKLWGQPKREAQKPPPDFHSSVTLEFDGKELKAMENGKVVQSWSAVSGRPGFQSPEYQGEKNKGPIPEGDWVLRQGGHQKIPHGGVSEWYERTKNWRGGEDAWGKERVWMDPLPGTDIKDRSGFSVHGGKDPGSAGCIDLTGQVGQFAEYFRSLGKDVKIKVRYPRE